MVLSSNSTCSLVSGLKKARERYTWCNSREGHDLHARTVGGRGSENCLGAFFACRVLSSAGDVVGLCEKKAVVLSVGAE